MTFITPFEEEFCQKIHTIYAINNDDPLHNYCGGSTTISEVCPHCNARNIFRVYEPRREYETDEYFVAIYDCKCPECRKEFEIKDEWEKEDED